MLGRDRAHFEMRMREVGIRKIRVPVEKTVDAPGVAIVDASVLEAAEPGLLQRLMAAAAAIDLVALPVAGFVDVIHRRLAPCDREPRAIPARRTCRRDPVQTNKQPRLVLPRNGLT